VWLRVVCPVCGLLLYSRAPDDGHNVAPKRVEQAIRSVIKTHLLHLVGILFPHSMEGIKFGAKLA
jgi:hypothetical protein